MFKIGRIITTTRFGRTFVCLALAIFAMVNSVMAQTTASKEETVQEKVTHIGPEDKYDRGVPRSSIKGYLSATSDGDYERASQYLDLRNLPRGISKSQGPELAQKLIVVFDRALWIDLNEISDHPKGDLQDGLPTYRDLLGRIETPKKTVDILLQRIPRQDGVFIWKISNRTVAEIPHLYKYFGFRKFEEWLSKQIPDYTVLGWKLWQWVIFLVLFGLAYAGAFLLTLFVGLLLQKKDSVIRLQASRLVTGPLRILLWLLLIYPGIHYIGPSASVRAIMHAGTLVIIGLTWTTIAIGNFTFNVWAEQLRKRGQESITILLRPVKKILNIFVIVMAVLLWLDNIGFNISTLLAGLGVGGLAIALASQDTLKNFIGSIIILLDKPYRIGQRIVVKGHDGVVEEIGLRSTRLRLLNGNQTTIPNEEMARLDIENIGRRLHIRRLTNITITYDTPPKKIEKALDIILKILDNHEGMDPELPPRAYFNEFNPSSLNLVVFYWYHLADYWKYMAHSQQVNLKIMQEFEKAGIKFAFPTNTTYLIQEDKQPLQVRLADEPQLKVVSES